VTRSGCDCKGEYGITSLETKKYRASDDHVFSYKIGVEDVDVVIRINREEKGQLHYQSSIRPFVTGPISIRHSLVSSSYLDERLDILQPLDIFPLFFVFRVLGNEQRETIIDSALLHVCIELCLHCYIKSVKVWS